MNSLIFYLGILHLRSQNLLKLYGLLSKREVKMAGYWARSFLRVYGPRRSRGL